jgi:hypothetical protein
MTEKQIIEEAIRYARRHGIEPRPKQIHEVVGLWRSFKDLGMQDPEAFERARDLVFRVVEDSPWRC